MPRNKINFPGPFQGLVTSQDASRLAPGQASDASNVYTSDGSIRSRMGYDFLNSTVPQYSVFDNFLRDNSADLGTATSGHVWGDGLIIDPSTTTNSFSIYHGRARGENEGTILSCGNILFASDGSSVPLSSANQYVEFLLRKHQGMGTIVNSFPMSASTDSNVAAALTCTFAVHLRAQSSTQLIDTSPTGDDDYHVEFDVPCGPFGNDLVWDDMVIRVYRMINGSQTQLTAGTSGEYAGGTYTGTDEGPGVDEWIPIKIYINTEAGNPVIRVYVDGTLRVSETDSNAAKITANGYIKIRATNAGSGTGDIALKRQVEIASFIAYTGVENNDPNLNVTYFSDQFGTEYLVSKNRNNILSMSNGTEVGSGSLSFLTTELPKVNRRNAILGLTTTATSYNNALLTWDKGAETFTITDADTNGRDLTSYTFAEGDKLEIMAVSSRTDEGATIFRDSGAGQDDITIGGWCDYKRQATSQGDSGTVLTISIVANTTTFTATVAGDTIWSGELIGATDTKFALGYGLWVSFGSTSGYSNDTWSFSFHPQVIEPGVYEVDSKPTNTTVKCKGNPSRGFSGIIANAHVAYRIVSKTYLGGVMPITSSSGIMDHSPANGLLYMADGSDRMYATNGDGARLNGIRHPELSPGTTTDTSIDGNVYGTSQDIEGGSIKFTYYDLFTATESIQSNEGVVFTATSSPGTDHAGDFLIPIQSSTLEGSADSRATHVRIYIKSGGRETTTEWTRINTTPLPLDDENGIVNILKTEVYASNGLYEETLDSVDNSLPPAASVIEFHRDRMWYCKDNSTQIFASAVGVPDYVDPTNSFHAGRTDGQKVTALVSGKSLLLDQVTDVLVVGKERSLYTFTNTATLSEIKIDKVGEVGPGGVMAWAIDENGVLYFGGERGIHMWRGGDVVDLHYAIQDTYFGYNMTNLDKMSLAIDVQEGLLLVALNSDGGAQNDKILVMNYRKPPVQGPRGVLYEWTIWDLEATSLTVDTEDGLPKLRFGTSTGQIATYRGDAGTVATDNGAGITWNWDGPKLHMNTELKKRWHNMGVEIEKGSTSSNILIGHKLNEETTATTKRFDQSLRRRILHSVQRRGEYLIPVFKGEAATQTSRILGYDISTRQIGRR